MHTQSPNVAGSKVWQIVYQRACVGGGGGGTLHNHEFSPSEMDGGGDMAWPREMTQTKTHTHTHTSSRVDTPLEEYAPTPLYTQHAHT